MPQYKLDREMYLNIAKSEGLAAALTRLQTDTIRWEYTAFEGPEGYQPQLWEDLDEARVFARELWDMDLALAKPGSRN